MIKCVYRWKIWPVTTLTRSFSSDGKRIIRDADVLSQYYINAIMGIEEDTKGKQVSVKKDPLSGLYSKDMFYDLVPLKNIPYPVCIDRDFRELEETANQNIFYALGLTVYSSYDDYTKGMRKFWSYSELYGDETQSNKIYAESLYFKDVLVWDSKELEKIRRGQIINISIPGSIYNVDARKFLDLRPVYYFRHTPIIPITDSMMERHKYMIQRHHRSEMVFEVSIYKVINWVMFAVAVGIAGYMINTVLEKEEEKTVAYTRMQYNRKKGINEQTSFKF